MRVEGRWTGGYPAGDDDDAANGGSAGVPSDTKLCDGTVRCRPKHTTSS